MLWLNIKDIGGFKNHIKYTWLLRAALSDFPDNAIVCYTNFVVYNICLLYTNLNCLCSLTGQSDPRFVYVGMHIQSWPSQAKGPKSPYPIPLQKVGGLRMRLHVCGLGEAR